MCGDGSKCLGVQHLQAGGIDGDEELASGLCGVCVADFDLSDPHPADSDTSSTANAITMRPRIQYLQTKHGQLSCRLLVNAVHAIPQGSNLHPGEEICVFLSKLVTSQTATLPTPFAVSTRTQLRRRICSTR